ncbi:hypothetical protein GCM10027176_52980 [Actinoallomurus bryophytorum]|uniref:Suppressor of fused protein SUFU n=2 Tax=Actinoallomurus bryophytorum TaxID=1490222 RepID=A0A543CH98_9ACTN|nr:suppressor of fused protein SUFU [Actinoallomurus bryophytorum]
MRLYLDHLSDWAGREPESHLITADGTEPPVFAFTCPGRFGMNTISGFTYGLSLVPHPEWHLGSPELFISMDSDNSDWVLAAGYVASAWRGKERYSAGDVFDLGDPISPDESEMSVLLLFLVTDLEPEFTRIELPGGVVNLVQLYPMYESELALLQEKGAAEFLSTEDVDFHDPRRPPLNH